MSIRNAIKRVRGYTGSTGRYTVTVEFADGVNPADYRARMFMEYAGTNDLSSATGTGLYAIPRDPCDTILYDDWNCVMRPAFVDLAEGSHNASFNTEIVCGFSGEDREHTVEFCDQAGNPVRLGGESVLNGEYTEGNLPVNLLFEKRIREVSAEIISYGTNTGKVTVVTAGPHGFSDGDAVTVSGLPSTDHSTGVSGERYNGTFRISVVDDCTFTYASMFYPGFREPTLKYTDCSQVVISKWIVCEYLVDKEIVPSMAEALVIWPGHTFRKGDRVTVCNGTEPVAVDAVLDEPSPNAFVCRSSSIGLESGLTSIIYAPRTPIWEIPVNYIMPDPVVEEPKNIGKKVALRSAPQDVTRVNNGSQLRASDVNTGRQPEVLLACDLNDPITDESGDAMHISTSEFIVLRFIPAVMQEFIDGNAFQFRFRVSGSTEVSTDVCMYRVGDNDWSADTSSADLYADIVKVPLGRVTIDTLNNDCDYSAQPQFTINIDSDIGDAWVHSAEPISIAFLLYGRDGARITIPRESVDIVQYHDDGQGGDIPVLPVKAIPDLITPGDTVTIYSMNAGSFSGQAGRMRIKLGNADDPEDWIPVTTCNGESLTFIMPQGFSGRQPITVMQLVGNEWKVASQQIIVDVYVVTPKTVSLNERMRPGETDKTVSYTATYNRDLAYDGFAEITDENSMIQNLYSCLLTRRGERLFNRDFGTTLEEMVFSLRSAYSDNAVMKECLDAISTYEPRITLIYEQCKLEDMGPHGVRLVLGVEVPGGTVQTISIPFKNRGRLI